jgi:hypothetical protein
VKSFHATSVLSEQKPSGMDKKEPVLRTEGLLCSWRATCGWGGSRRRRRCEGSADIEIAFGTDVSCSFPRINSASRGHAGTTRRSCRSQAKSSGCFYSEKTYCARIHSVIKGCTSVRSERKKRISVFVCPNSPSS